MSSGRRAQVAVVAWCAVSVGLALLPAGVGGPLRAVDAGLFMLFGPSVAGLVTAQRTRSARSPDAPAVPLSVEVLLWTSASIAALALTSTGIVFAGLWSTPTMVAVVAVETLLLALWPIRSALGTSETPGAQRV